MIKHLSFFFFLFFHFCLFGQDENRFPIYPGCEKKQSNNELIQCFKEKMFYEMRENFTTHSNDYYASNQEYGRATLVFTITKKGKFDKLSYTADSNPLVAKKFLKQIIRLQNYYQSKHKNVQPAMINGQPIDFEMRLTYNYDSN